MGYRPRARQGIRYAIQPSSPGLKITLMPRNLKGPPSLQKSMSRKVATTNPGMDTPKVHITRNRLSIHFPRLYAARHPNGMPRAMAQSRATTPMLAESGNFSTMMSSTGRSFCIFRETPKSPRVTIPPRYRSICTPSGSFRPYFSSIIAFCSGVIFSSLNGLPGTLIIRTNVTQATTTMVMRAIMTRFTMYFAILSLPNFILCTHERNYPILAFAYFISERASRQEEGASNLMGSPANLASVRKRRTFFHRFVRVLFPFWVF